MTILQQAVESGELISLTTFDNVSPTTREQGGSIVGGGGTAMTGGAVILLRVGKFLVKLRSSSVSHGVGYM